MEAGTLPSSSVVSVNAHVVVRIDLSCPVAIRVSVVVEQTGDEAALFIVPERLPPRFRYIQRSGRP